MILRVRHLRKCSLGRTCWNQGRGSCFECKKTVLRRDSTVKGTGMAAIQAKTLDGHLKRGLKKYLVNLSPALSGQCPPREDIYLAVMLPESLSYPIVETRTALKINQLEEGGPW